MNEFKTHFNLGSFLPLLLCILGIYNVFLFVNNEMDKGFFVMIFSFIIYVSNNIILQVEKRDTVFNEYLEESSAFLAFGLTTIIFGFIIFKNDVGFLAIVSLYSIHVLLGQSRNWVLEVRNSKGWPIALNGIFFPLFYYITKIYFQDFNYIFFIVFYIVIGILSISHYNFVTGKEND